MPATFKTFLLGEATVSVSRWEASLKPVLDFLEKHLGVLHRLPGVEKFVNSKHGKGHGLRYFFGNRSLRFDFSGTGDKPYAIDVWDGRGFHPNRTVHVKGIDLTKVGKSLLDALKGAVKEADDEPKLRVSGPSEDKHENDVVARLERDARKAGAVPYEQQLEDLEDLLRGVVKKNLANAVFIGGRGGVGKTHTVEKVLHDLGLSDGKGYFKISGSASPAAVYRKLFDYRDDLVLFDDSDSALESQEGRNIFKAATDTKKVRKIAWERAGGNIFNPDKPPEILKGDPESIKIWLDQQASKGAFPSHFNFNGKVIFISNLPLDKLDPDGALRTRAYVIAVDPTNQEILDYMRKIADKIPLEQGSLTHAERMEVVDELQGEDDLSLRKLVRGLNMRAAGMPNWRRLLRSYA